MGMCWPLGGITDGLFGVLQEDVLPGDLEQSMV